MGRKRDLLAWGCLLSLPAIIFLGITVVSATNQICSEGPSHLPIDTYGCNAPTIQIESRHLYVNGTVEFVLFNPTSAAVSIDRITIFGSASPTRSVATSYSTQIPIVNNTVTTNTAYSDTASSSESSNATFECDGKTLVPIASDSQQIERCTVSGSVIRSGEVYNYIIFFSNGQSVIGALVA